MKNPICFTIIFACAVVCAVPQRSLSQSDTSGGAALMGGPLLSGASDEALACATNLGSTPALVTLKDWIVELPGPPGN
jgi:hypothetical protein